MIFSHYKKLRLTTRLSLLLLYLPLWVNAEVETNNNIEQRLEALENEVAILRKHSSQTTSHNLLDRISINGYLNFVLSQSTEEVPYWSGEDNRLSLSNHSKGGIRFSASLSEETHAVIQLDMEPDTDGSYEVGIEWFYLQHQFNENFFVKAGRLSAPVLNYSEEFNVGFAYPWIRPPEEVYEPLPLNEIDGINFTYHEYFGELGLRIKGTWGYNDSTFGNSTISQDNIFGLDTELSYKHFTVRASQLQMKFKVDLQTINSRIIDTDYTLTSFGFTFDNNKIILTGEYAGYKLDEPTPFFSDENSYYLTTGWYIGKFMPYYTYATTDADDTVIIDVNGQVIAPLTGRHQRGQYLGLRYNINDQSALTFEVQYIDDFHGSYGLFGGEGGTLLSNGETVDFDSATIFHLAYQAVF